MNPDTPFRGILLYHGLGSGKSGASIATSEGFHNRQIVIMLPASLRTNYEIEIEKFANIGYRRNHNWCFIPLDIKWKKGETKPLSVNEPIIQILVEKGIGTNAYRDKWQLFDQIILSKIVVDIESKLLSLSLIHI